MQHAILQILPYTSFMVRDRTLLREPSLKLFRYSLQSPPFRELSTNRLTSKVGHPVIRPIPHCLYKVPLLSLSSGGQKFKGLKNSGQI